MFRGRRGRATQAIRKARAETHLSVADLIQPYFVIPGKNQKSPIGAMPGIERLTIDHLLRQLDKNLRLGVQQIILFGVIPDKLKDTKGSFAYQDDGLVQTSVRAIKKRFPQIQVITDVCLCGYTSHGHCGLINSRGQVDNDASLPLLAVIALSHARAGADIVAPSDMMDGRVGVIRAQLNRAGYGKIPILSYAAKYASAFYGPFREAAASAMKRGPKDRKTYQMDPANIREAMREIRADINEGAKMVMVKPALAYLDVIREAKNNFTVPIYAYNVSGEYSMIKAATAQGWLDEKNVVLETLLGMKRAGASKIITYHANDVSHWLAQ